MPAAHLFMKITEVDGLKFVIPGEAEVEGYEGQIVLDDWSWAVARRKQDDRSVTEPSVLSFSKELDRATTSLLIYQRSGNLLPKAAIVLEEAADVDFRLKLKLTDVRVQGYELEGSVEDTQGRLMEKWVFNYHTIEFSYEPTRSELRANRTREKSGALKALLTRPPGASNESVASDEPKDKVLDAVKTLSPSERKSLFASVEKECDTLALARQSGRKPPDGAR